VEAGSCGGESPPVGAGAQPACTAAERAICVAERVRSRCARDPQPLSSVNERLRSVSQRPGRTSGRPGRRCGRLGGSPGEPGRWPGRRECSPAATGCALLASGRAFAPSGRALKASGCPPGASGRAPGASGRRDRTRPDAAHKPYSPPRWTPRRGGREDGASATESRAYERMERPLGDRFPVPHVRPEAASGRVRCASGRERTRTFSSSPLGGRRLRQGGGQEGGAAIGTDRSHGQQIGPGT
jgi:hypothetical protein